jgi:glycosyltransferase involved in cell wall biosynthesis
VVNDGSEDETGSVLASMGEKQLKLASNLGYGKALQTGMKFAIRHNYDVIISFDADGQHRPEDVSAMVNALLDGDADLVIGSRFYGGRPYTGPLNRRLGQIVFSYMTKFLTGQRIYDTSSGFKAMRSTTCEFLIPWTFMDFHIETIVRLCMTGHKIIEHPITVNERLFGSSMHSTVSNIAYPIKSLLMTIVAAMDVILTRRTK